MEFGEVEEEEKWSRRAEKEGMWMKRRWLSEVADGVWDVEMVGLEWKREGEEGKGQRNDG